MSGLVLPAVGVKPVRYKSLILNTPGLVSAWPLDETSGTTADDAFGANNGTYTGGFTLNQVGPIRGHGAVDLNGTTGTILTSYTPFVTNSTRSFEGWVYRDASSSGDNIFGGDGARPPYFLHIAAPTNEIRFTADWLSASDSYAAWSGAEMWVGRWTHFVLTFNDSTDAIRLIENGVDRGAGTGPTSAIAYATPGNFSMGTEGGFDNFDGRLSWYAVYSRILTVEEAQMHYLAGIKGRKLGLAA